MKKKVLLIQPPFYRLMGSHFNSLVLGLGYISAVLNKEGHTCHVYNADYLDESAYANQRQIFEGYEQYKTLLNNENHEIWNEVLERVVQYSPDFVGISMLTGTFKSSLIIAKKIKQDLPETKIIVGGIHPTILPKECLEKDFIDFAVVGEGELTIKELINGKRYKDIQGLAYKNQGKIIVNDKRPFIGDLDSIPFPDRQHLIPKPDNNQLGSIITSRGCPFACTFCAARKIWGQETRLRSIDNVFQEVENLYYHYNVRTIHFRDDTLTLWKDRIQKLCRRIIEEKIEIGWTCKTRVDRVDEETLTLMKNAGCARVKIGVESGSDKILKKIKKGITAEKVKKTVKLIKKVGLKFTVSLLIGFPDETEEDIRKTMDLALELDADYYSLSILTPYFGTEMYDNFIEKNSSKDIKEHWEYFFHQSKAMILADGISEETVDEFLLLNEICNKRKRV